MPCVVVCSVPGRILPLKKKKRKKYINEIRKFFLWCKDNQITLRIPFSSPVVSLYLFNLDRQLRIPASMVLTRAALKCLFPLVPDDSPSLLDNASCKTIIECAKRTRSRPVNKKKPVDSDVIKSIIDRFGGEEASLKDLRIAAISTLGFAGYFRFNELANIQPNHLTFYDDFVKIFVPKSRPMCIERGIGFMSLS